MKSYLNARQNLRNRVAGELESGVDLQSKQTFSVQTLKYLHALMKLIAFGERALNGDTGGIWSRKWSDSG